MAVAHPETADVNKTLLVVDDDAHLRSLTADTLRHAGFTVVEAENTDVALTYVRAARPLGLVFTDVTLPGSVDGIGLAKIVLAEFPQVKVIITSGNPVDELLPEGIVFLRKPYILGRVITAIRHELSLEP